MGKILRPQVLNHNDYNFQRNPHGIFFSHHDNDTRKFQEERPCPAMRIKEKENLAKNFSVRTLKDNILKGSSGPSWYLILLPSRFRRLNY